MEDFIYRAESLSTTLCDKIIELFENEPTKVPGKTGGGYNPKIKKTTDFCIPVILTTESIWFEINDILHNQLYHHLDIYINKIKEKYNVNLLNRNFLFEDTFMIQKYEKNKGEYVYHHDFSLNIKKQKYRMLTFIWYLNDVEEGGETEFWGSYIIKPKKGYLLLFPSGWFYKHCGKMPISSCKYIITGWLYTEIKNI
jgi:hypothetical protein